MDLDFSEEQEMLRDMVRGMCSEYASVETVRAVEDEPIGFSKDSSVMRSALSITGTLSVVTRWVPQSRWKYCAFSMMNKFSLTPSPRRSRLLGP